MFGLLPQIFFFRFIGKCVYLHASCLDHEGRFAIVTNRWVRDAVVVSGCSVIYHADEQRDAHGEIVWS